MCILNGLDQVFLPKGCSNLVIVFSIDVNQNIPNWKTYLMAKLVGATTLPVDFYLKVKQHAAWRIKPALLVNLK